jgi:dihydroflavonol-4-reductase
MTNRVFITGASGFIGANLVNELTSCSDRVFALVRKPTGYIDRKATIILGDILVPESFISVIKECDTIFHCAAYISFQKKDFQRLYRVNVEGTRNILEAAYKAGAKKVVYLSACAVLGFSLDKNKIIDETANPRIEKNNAYAYTKRLAEEEVRKYVQKGLNASIANIATVYGRGDSRLNSGGIIKSIYEGKMKLIPPGGTSFVSIDDLVKGLTLLAEKGRTGERYIFCTENMEYKLLIQRIARTLKVKEPGCILPRFSYYPALWAVKGIELLSRFNQDKVNLTTAQILKETYGYKYFSSKKAEAELGWRPLESLEEAVEKAFSYYKENQLI